MIDGAWQVRSVPRGPDRSAPNEDAAGRSVRKGGSARFAVADGVTSAYGSGLWARLLVAEWTRAAPDLGWGTDWETRVAALAARWRTEADPGEAAPWHAGAHFARGSAATFLCGSLHPAARGTAHVELWSVGDVCAFLLRNGRVRTVPPRLRPSWFGDFPRVVHTDRLPLPEPTARASLRLVRGDRLLVTTDALGAYLVRRRRDPEVFADLLAAGVRTAGFARRVRHHRSLGLADDDTTYLSIDWGGD